MPPKKKGAKVVEDEPDAKKVKTEEEEPKKDQAQPQAEKGNSKQEREEALEKAKQEREEALEKARLVAEEEAREKEGDAPKDPRTPLKDLVGFDALNSTLNVVPTMGGRLLKSLGEGGMQFLIAGARANVGVRAGRYLFEVKILEAINLDEGVQYGGRKAPSPKQLVRVGFSVAGSSLVLGDSEDAVAFDSEGYLWEAKKRQSVGRAVRSAAFGRDQVVGVLLNLDPKTTNANTISLFRDGVRVTPPQQLPDNLKGKPLFPHVCFRSVAVQVSFGPQPLKPLPFRCRSLQEAAEADTKDGRQPTPKDGKYDVLFPVGFPDEGTFDWLNSFLEKNQQYTELSDRAIQAWAVKSGFWKSQSKSWKNSNDRPEFNFGVPFMDDMSVRRAVYSIASIVPRHYIVMEVKENLVAADRARNLQKFSGPGFKRIAHVVMGDPTKDFVEKVHAKLLAEKKEKAELIFKAQKLERERKHAAKERQKQLAETKKKAEEERKQRLEEARKKAAEAIAKKKAEEEGDENKPADTKEEGKRDEEAKDVEMPETKKDPAEAEKTEGEKIEGDENKQAETKEENKRDEEAKDVEMTGKKKEPAEAEKEEDEKMEEKKEDEEEEKEEELVPPEVELSEEERKTRFKPAVLPDLTPQVLNCSFGSFSIPEQAEGFDTIRYEWQNAKKSKEYLKAWVLERKLTSRVEDLVPSEWFKSQLEAFSKQLAEWKKKQKEPNSSTEKKDDEDDEEDKVTDIMSVKDVCNIGRGVPLFENFAFEDWGVLSLRFELWLLTAAFRKDVNDPERFGIHESHVNFYYTRYYKKSISCKAFGKETLEDLLALVKDTVALDGKSVLQPSEALQEEPESLDIFVKLTEESRRERQRRLDAGDETVRLKFDPGHGLAPQQGSWGTGGAAGGAAGCAAAGDGKGGGKWRAGKPQYPRKGQWK